MEGESPKPASTPTGAVFLSYASQDAEAAARICSALRAAGIEVWFDQSELRGGDVWDQKIRRQIHDCALFIPVISANTASRREGYFRLEWDLADRRSHMMARDSAFIVPVSLDAAPGAGSDVPESFHRVQWTRLPAGAMPPAFVERVRRLLSPEQTHEAAVSRPAGGAGSAAVPAIRRPLGAPWQSKAALLAIVALAICYLALDRLVLSKRPGEARSASTSVQTTAPGTAAFSPPPHSIAVLPFVNMSGDKEQEYFSDGLSEELLNDLARISGLQVAARTSAFSFKGKDTDISTIAHKLNVGAVLEGSVRHSGHTIRVTAQLINAVTGFHLWSETYDRDLGDVLKLQTEIANAVASTLKVRLLGDIASKVELGGTSNPPAFDAYLRGMQAFVAAEDTKGEQAAIDAFTEAIRHDPHYALAFARRSLTFSGVGAEYATSDAERREIFDRAHADARKAIELAPDLPEGHVALGYVFESGSLDFAQASAEYERAMALAPGNAGVLRAYSHLARDVGHADAAIAAARRAVMLDPLNALSHEALGTVFLFARHYEQAVDAYRDALVLNANLQDAYAFRGFAYYLLGDLRSAHTSCATKPDFWISQECLAVIYDKLGRHADAEAMRAKIQSEFGDASAYNYAQIYAQWGNTFKALEWLQTALRLRDPGLMFLKVDPLLDPLREEPRFQAVERELKFPS